MKHVRAPSGWLRTLASPFLTGGFRLLPPGPFSFYGGLIVIREDGFRFFLP